MTKQQAETQQTELSTLQKEQAQTDEQFVLENLLKNEKYQNEMVAKVRAGNKKVQPEDDNRDFIRWEKTHEEIKKNRWLQEVTTPQSHYKKFWQAKMLHDAQLIPDEYDQYDSIEYPRVELIRMGRYSHSNGDEYLVRLFNFIGLNRMGVERKKPLDEIDYVIPVTVRVKAVPENPELKNGPVIRVGEIPFNDSLPPNNPIKLLTPFDADLVKYSIERWGNGKAVGTKERKAISLYISKSGKEPMGVNLQEFLVEDVNELWRRREEPVINVDKTILKQIADQRNQHYA